MVASVDSTMPLAICKSKARDFHFLRSFLVCVLSLWLTLSAAQALDPNKRLTQYAHTAWRIQDGFLPNTPFWISQSKEGYLWVGNKRSVWRFDGIRFTPWSPPIAATRIRKLVSVRVGEFWIATQSELVHVRDNVVISHYDVPVITGMHEDSDGSMWALSLASTDRILCHATDSRISCFGKAEGITFHNPLPIIPDGKGGFWIGGDTSLLHWKVGAAPEIYSPQQLRSNVGRDPIHSLVRNSDGSLWVGMESTGPGRGLERFRNGVLTPVVLPNFDGSKLNIEALIEDSDKNLWIATYGNGIYRIHDQTVEHFGRADGLSSDAVFDLYEGSDGIVWAATSNGIDNFRDLPVTTFSSTEGLGRDGANSVMATKDGTVWVANLGTLDIIRNGAVSSVRVPGEQVSSLLEDHQGNIWVGVDDELFIYKDGRFRRITGPDHHPLGMVLGITEDIDGNIWAQCKGTQRRLVRIRDFKVREEFSEPPVPPANAIAADPKGGIWLGALTGDLTFFREGIARTFPLNLKGSWAEKTAHQIAVDPDGSVITASENGLVVLRDGKARRMGKENGLPCDGVTGFAVDDKRNLWLDTPCGFTEIAASDVQRWWVHPDTIVQARVFGTLDGALPGSVTFNPAAKSLDGRLWFVNNVVLQMIDPSHLSGDETVSPVYVETVVADRKQYKPQEGLQLPPLTRDLQIGYTSPSFLIPQKVKFRFRLDGHDRDWQDAGTRREAFYTDLGPGKYRFRVTSSNDNGVWNEAGASLDFAIAPAFYQTAWFRSLGVFLFLALLAGFFRLRIRHLERQRDALRKSEKELRDVIDAIPTIAWSALPDGSNIYVNKRFAEYSGLSGEQAARSGWQAATHPGDLQQHLSKWKTSVATGDPFQNEVRIRRADCQYRWHLCRGVPMQDGQERIVRWYGILFDIDELKKTESALQEREHELLGIIDTVPSMLWSASPAGEVTHISQRVLEYGGLHFEDFLNLGWKRLIHPDDFDSTAKAFFHAIQTGEPYNAVHRLRRADGEYRWYHARGEPLRGPHGEIVQWYGLSIDIEDRKRAEQERERMRQLEADLAHTNRVSTLGEMAASLAHEIKQPIAAAITSANSCVEWLAHEPPNLDRARSAAARVDKYGNRAAEIIDRIRSFYKKSPPQRELVYVNGIIQEMLTLLKGEADRCSVTMRTDLAAELPKIKADRVQLQQVLMNLMVNGIEAMRDTGGELTVKSQRQDGQLLFSVSDTGVGLPEGKTEQIFSAFYTTKSQGSGMGLAISRSIVESHGGRLWASANSGGGATFHFTLPIQVTESSHLIV
jgi:PAS domain S-box-containing protein